MKRYYPWTGFIISIFIALLGYVLRSSREDVDASFFSFIGSFCNAYFCWLVVQWIIQIDKIGGYLLRCFIALAGCIAVSLFVFYIKQEFGSVHNKAPVFKLGVRAMSYLLVTRGMVIGGFLFFIAYLLRISELSQRSRIENEYLKRENLNARLSLLQEQVSPHFFFNSLGTLRSMISDAAPRLFIQRLSDVYRYLLNNKMADLVTLEAELDFSLAYLHILKERFEDALQFDINIRDQWYPRKLPPMTLQMLIENAVKHNAVDIETPLKICIETTGDGNWLVVVNTLRRRSSMEESVGTGLNNIRERYRLLAGKEIAVEESDQEFKVCVPLIVQ